MRPAVRSGTAGRVLLVGAGHAHLHALARGRDYGHAGGTLLVVAPSFFWYSGLATGMLGGMYSAELDRLDIDALASAHGAHREDALAARVDPRARRVQLVDGRELEYDVLSLNVGSSPAPLPGSDTNADVYDVKPIERLHALRERLIASFAGRDPVAGRGSRSAATALRIIVAGGGQTGCEVAANIVALASRNNAAVAVTLVTGGTRLLEALPRSAANRTDETLRRRGVEVRCAARLERVDRNTATLSSGRALEFDVLVNATGLKPSPLIAATGLPLSDEGALLVDSPLRSVGDDRVFGGGDCIAFDGRSLPRVGVYAVRQGPVLHHNLLATLAGERTKPFRPQRRFLSIMNLGDGTAVATRGGWWSHSRLAFSLKDWIDRRFLAQYRRATPASD